MNLGLAEQGDWDLDEKIEEWRLGQGARSGEGKGLRQGQSGEDRQKGS